MFGESSIPFVHGASKLPALGRKGECMLMSSHRCQTVEGEGLMVMLFSVKSHGDTLQGCKYDRKSQ